MGVWKSIPLRGIELVLGRTCDAGFVAAVVFGLLLASVCGTAAGVSAGIWVAVLILGRLLGYF
jgi:hypothetical protein